MDEYEFFDRLSRAPVEHEAREAYALWLQAQGEPEKAGYVRHRASFGRLPLHGRTSSYHRDAMAELESAIDPAWTARFDDDRSPFELQRLECTPLWAGAVPDLPSSVPRLYVVDGISVYFTTNDGRTVDDARLARWGTPFEHVVANTVVLYDDDFESWTPVAGTADRVFLFDDGAGDGYWAQWLYAGPELWENLESKDDGEALLVGPPALVVLDASRALLTSANDPAGLEHAARVAAGLLDGRSPVTVRPLRPEPRANWAFLADDENPVAELWGELFGPHRPAPMPRRDLLGPLELIDDAEERVAARGLVDCVQPRRRVDFLHVSGSRGDWRIGEPREAVELPTMTSMSNLLSLSIRDAEIPDHWWDGLASCTLPRLTALSMKSCRYTGRKAGLVSAFPSLECLGLSIVVDEALPGIASLPNLRELDLARTHVTDAGLEELRGSRLWFLDLSECDVSDEALQSVATMQELRGLYLNDTEITDAGLERLVELPCLEHLDLRGTRVTDDAIVPLAEMKSLRHVEGLSSTAIVLLVDELPNLGHRR